MAMNPRLLRPLQTGFSPKKLAGLQLWLDAADSSTITTDTGVSEWRDKSATGSKWSPVSGNTQPATGTQTINGKNVIVFNGTNTSLTANITPLSTSLPLTFFIVQRIVTATSFGMSYAVQDTNFFIGQQGTTGALRVLGTNANLILQTEPSRVGINDVLAITFPAAAGATATIRRNGAALTPDDATVRPTLTGTHYIGRRGGGLYFDGWIAEVIAYNAELNAASRLSVERYLARKWGITLA